MNKIILDAKGITKSFGGVHALKDVDFSIAEGEKRALIGENGAGKSTLMKILLGIHSSDKGEVYYKGEKANFTSPAQALAHGISMIHQEISLIPEMDVAENIWFGREKDFMIGGTLINRNLRYEKTKELLESLWLDDLDPRAIVKDLSVAQMQLVELARAVSYQPSIIIMDEPTSALSDKEVDLLFKIINDLASKKTAIVFISHKLEEIYTICESVTVLRDGELIKTAPCTEITMDKLIHYIVGREERVLFEKPEIKKGEVALEVKGFNSTGVFHDVNFSVRKGEILGFCGLMGAGRSEIMRAVFGIDKKTSGQVFINGKEAKIRMPKDAVKYGMAMVTEDRLRMGVIYTMSIIGNTTLAYFDKICSKLVGFFRPKKENDIFEEAAQSISIKYGKADDLIGSLSGGNQQKAIIARWLLTKPDILLLDEPTRGIDIGAKSEIYTIISKLAEQGLAIVMISSEMPEILSLSDRICVVRGGRIVFTCDRADATQELLMSYSFET